jgi:hypothetical protein
MRCHICKLTARCKSQTSGELLFRMTRARPRTHTLDAVGPVCQFLSSRCPTTTGVECLLISLNLALTHCILLWPPAEASSRVRGPPSLLGTAVMPLPKTQRRHKGPLRSLTLHEPFTVCSGYHSEFFCSGMRCGHST